MYTAKKSRFPGRLWRWLCITLLVTMVGHGALCFVQHLQHPAYSAPAWTAWLVMLYYLPAALAAGWKR